MWEVEVTRGGVVESRHQVWAVGLDAAGSVIEESGPGDAGRTIFLRSAAKPFQASGAVERGVFSSLGLTSEHLAIACSSHGGDDRSVALVRQILAAANVDEAAMTPGDEGQGGPLHHQCSGNHAMALAWCAVEGWDLDGYLHADHPVQTAMADSVRAAAGSDMVLAPDNCGMVAHGLVLAAVGPMFRALSLGRDDTCPGLAETGAAMRLHRDLIGSNPGIDSELMAHNDRLVAKVGAEALLVAATPESSLVVRVGDGGVRALTAATRELAERWFGWVIDDAGPTTPNRDAHGRQVGVLRAVNVTPRG